MKVKYGVATVVVGALALTACGEPKEVSGLRDDVRQTKAVKAVPELSHKVTKTRTKYKTVCTSYKKGVCKSKSKVPDGTEKYTEKVIDRHYKPGKAKQYCVELDNVNGDKDRDDVWFNVSHATYLKHLFKDEGMKIEKMPYNHEGC
ncbi:hypothetical protein SEA_ALONE_130 [Streptomyces phage Alone3]|nr:hypothetical protein SEA_ALONE_130 [Streptomyces phage Alone3]